MTIEEALKKMQVFIDFFPAAKTEIEEIVIALSNPICHTSYEEPTKDTYILIEVSLFEDKLEYYSYYWCTFICLSWKEFVKKYHVKQWMYISDIFPIINQQ